MLLSFVVDPAVFLADLDASDNVLYPTHGFDCGSAGKNVDKVLNSGQIQIQSLLVISYALFTQVLANLATKRSG